MSDRPATPSSTVPEDGIDRHLRFHENGTPCEWGESYRPGGFHPVQLGDILDGRYEILSKLGYGSFATVWLAADSSSRTLVAIKIVHGDVHKGNILVNVLLPQYKPESLENLRQPLDQARPLERLDGKKDVWALPYLLPPANLRSYVSTELDQFTKLTDFGQAFRRGQAPERIVTPDYLRAPETILRLVDTIGTGIDIWSFGCLVFELLTGSNLFMVSTMFAEGETLDDVHLIQLTEVLGPLPEQVFHAWRRVSCYFDANWRRSYNPEGDESLENDFSSDSGSSESEDGLPVSDDGESTFSDDDADTSNSEADLARVRLSEPLEEQFRRKKPGDIDEVEEKQILHLLRWILQYDMVKRPSAEEILRH
ncbi:serine/threonine-protein kinase SRPK3 [Diaporthe eres]|uniref:Protein kinase domain-containing protein n=1 Tax=Diaporthe vaccinii TaxID=105482 RepID=A0ABR4F9F7_9PEZI|nr:serine/threonine-protein kinase SRPK3 [Diaporthe eres]